MDKEEKRNEITHELASLQAVVVGISLTPSAALSAAAAGRRPPLLELAPLAVAQAAAARPPLLELAPLTVAQAAATRPPPPPPPPPHQVKEG